MCVYIYVSVSVSVYVSLPLGAGGWGGVTPHTIWGGRRGREHETRDHRFVQWWLRMRALSSPFPAWRRQGVGDGPAAYGSFCSWQERQRMLSMFMEDDWRTKAINHIMRSEWSDHILRVILIVYLRMITYVYFVVSLVERFWAKKPHCNRNTFISQRSGARWFRPTNRRRSFQCHFLAYLDIFWHSFSFGDQPIIFKRLVDCCR